MSAKVSADLKRRIEASAEAGKLRERGILTISAAVERGLRLVLLEAGEGPA